MPIAIQLRLGVPLLLLVSALPGGSAPSEPGRHPLVPRQLIQLFNGTNLNGWRPWLVDTRTKDPRKVFTATNGLLRISGDGLGYLKTEEAYRDYVLVVEFKWGRTNWSWGERIGRARDSGLFLHATGPDGNSQDGHGAFRAALECQIMQGAVGDLLLIRGTAADGALIAPRLQVQAALQDDSEGWPFWQRGGKSRNLERWGRVNWFGKSRLWKDVTDFRGPVDIESPSNEWTRIECLCRGRTLSIRVNGKEVNAVTEIAPSSGEIMLQCEGSEIFFRKVELRPWREGANF